MGRRSELFGVLSTEKAPTIKAKPPESVVFSIYIHRIVPPSTLINAPPQNNLFLKCRRTHCTFLSVFPDRGVQL